jgi:hypothetical protein
MSHHRIHTTHCFGLWYTAIIKNVIGYSDAIICFPGRLNNWCDGKFYSKNLSDFKGTVAWDFYACFWPVWIYLGLNGKRFWFFNFKEGSLILDSYFKYWCVSCQTFSEIRRISEKDWQLSLRFSNFSLFWVGGPPRNAAKGVNTSQRFIESPRMIHNLFRGSPRIFFNNISVSLIQLSILLGDSYETHQYLKLLYKIEEPSLKLTNHKRFTFRPRCIHTGQKQA